MSDNQKRYLDRPPRIQPELPGGIVDIPAPPKQESSANNLIRQAFLPLVTIIGYVLVSITGSGRNLLMIVPMGLAVVMSSLFAFYDYRRKNREEEEKKFKYQLRLNEMRKDMVNAHDGQRNFYMHNYPEPDEVIMLDGRPRADGSMRLWERRTSDEDFGAVRLGMGALPSTITYKMANTADNDESDAQRDAQKLEYDSEIVRDAPITIPLFDHAIGKPQGEQEENNGPEVRHTVGISGEAEHIYPFVQSMILHYAAFHAPTDISMHVVGIHSVEKNWSWIGELPQLAPSSKKQRDVFPVCFEDASGKDFDKEKDKVSRFWRELRSQLDQRKMRLDDKEAGDVRFPFLFIVVDMLEPLVSEESWLEKLGTVRPRIGGGDFVHHERGASAGCGSYLPGAGTTQDPQWLQGSHRGKPHQQRSRVPLCRGRCQHTALCRQG